MRKLCAGMLTLMLCLALAACGRPAAVDPEAAERELNVVLLTHYAAECFGFKQFYARMKEKLGIPCFFFADARLL